MNLATAFVIDTFYGQKFMKKLIAWDSVIVGELIAIGDMPSLSILLKNT